MKEMLKHLLKEIVFLILPLCVLCGTLSAFADDPQLARPLTVRELIVILQRMPQGSEVYLDELVHGDGERPITDVIEDDYCGGDVGRVILTNTGYAGQPKHEGSMPPEEPEEGR